MNKLVYLVLGIVVLGVIFGAMKFATQNVLGSGGLSWQQNYLTPPAKIGQLSFDSSAPIYDRSCGSDEVIRVGEPKSECWYVSVSFDESDYVIHYGETVQIHEFLKVSWRGIGTIFFNDRLDGQFKSEKEWTNFFEFQFVGNFIELEKIDSSLKLLNINEQDSFELQLNNKFTSFDGGLRVVTLTDILGVQSIGVQRQELQKGVHSYQVPIFSDKLGVVKTEVQPFIEVLGQRLYEDDKLQFSAHIIPNVQKTVNTSTSCNSDDDCPNELWSCVKYNKASLCEKSSVRNNLISVSIKAPSHNKVLPIILWVLIGLVVIVIFGYGVYKLRRFKG